MPPRKSNISQATATDNDGGTPVKERDGTNIEVKNHSHASMARAVLASPEQMDPYPLHSSSPTPPAGSLGAAQIPLPLVHQAIPYVSPSCVPPMLPLGSVLPVPRFLDSPNGQRAPLQESPYVPPVQQVRGAGDGSDESAVAAERSRIECEARDAVLKEQAINYMSRVPSYERPNPQYPLSSRFGALRSSKPADALGHGISSTLGNLQETAVRTQANRGLNGHYQATEHRFVHYQTPDFQYSIFPAPNPQIAHSQASNLGASVSQLPKPQDAHYQASNPQAFHLRTQNPLQHRALDPDSDYRRKQDLSLPRTMVQRLAKGVLQPNTSISKDALLALSKGATVFINYLAQSANEANLATNRKNIPPSAVFEGLNDIEFTDFIPRVEAELKRYNDVQTGKRNDYRRKVKEGKMGFGGRGGAGSGSGGEGDGEEGNGRAAKRVRRASGDTTESPEARRENGLGDPNQQLQQQMAEDDEDEDFDPPDDEEPEEAARELRQKPEEEEEGDEEEEEEDEDDEDAFPDEGMRLSSIERENYALDHPDDPVTPGSSADEEGSEEEGSD